MITYGKWALTQSIIDDAAECAFIVEDEIQEKKLIPHILDRN